MSLNVNNLSVLAYANNFTLWHYTTTDANVTDSGYFNNAVDMVNVGDFMIVNIDTDGSPSNKFYVVTGNTGSAVSVTVYS